MAENRLDFINPELNIGKGKYIVLINYPDDYYPGYMDYIILSGNSKATEQKTIECGDFSQIGMKFFSRFDKELKTLMEDDFPISTKWLSFKIYDYKRNDNYTLGQLKVKLLEPTEFINEDISSTSGNAKIKVPFNSPFKIDIKTGRYTYITLECNRLQQSDFWKSKVWQKTIVLGGGANILEGLANINTPESAYNSGVTFQTFIKTKKGDTSFVNSDIMLKRKGNTEPYCQNIEIRNEGEPVTQTILKGQYIFQGKIIGSNLNPNHYFISPIEIDDPKKGVNTISFRFSRAAEINDIYDKNINNLDEIYPLLRGMLRDQRAIHGDGHVFNSIEKFSRKYERADQHIKAIELWIELLKTGLEFYRIRRKGDSIIASITYDKFVADLNIYLLCYRQPKLRERYQGDYQRAAEDIKRNIQNQHDWNKIVSLFSKDPEIKEKFQRYKRYQRKVQQES
jgi:hypothetical protein